MKTYNCASKELCLFPNLGAADNRHKCLECGDAAHAVCTIQFFEQNPSSDFVVEQNQLSQSAKNRLSSLAQGSAEALICVLCAKTIKDRLLSDKVTPKKHKFEIANRVYVSAQDSRLGKNRDFAGTVCGIVDISGGSCLYDVHFTDDDQSPEGPFEECLLKANLDHLNIALPAINAGNKTKPNNTKQMINDEKARQKEILLNWAVNLKLDDVILTADKRRCFKYWW